MFSFRLILLLCLSLALSPFLSAGALSQGAPSFTTIDHAASIPAEIEGNVMFVQVMVNGRGPYRFLVDTGCSITIVSPQLADAAGAFVQITESDGPIAKNGFGNQVNVDQVMFQSVQLGGVRFEGVQAVVSDTFDKLSEIGGKRVDGALGFPVFADLFVALDFPRKRLVLGSEWPADLPQVRATIPVVEQADVPFVQTSLQGKAIQVMIDTGSNQGLQLPLEAEPVFNWTVTPRPGPLVAVFGETAREKIGRLAGSLLLGAIEQIEPTAVLSSGPSSIGTRSLKGYCAVFHQAENLVWLCGTDAGPIQPTAEKSVGLSLYTDPAGLRIAGVIPGSPAEEAKLDGGMIITQIENKPATQWSPDLLQQWIESHPEVSLVVSDKAGARAVTLKTWALVP